MQEGAFNCRGLECFSRATDTPRLGLSFIVNTVCAELCVVSDCASQMGSKQYRKRKGPGPQGSSSDICSHIVPVGLGGLDCF